MAELVLSALLPVLFEKLASAAVNKIAGYKRIDAEIKKWQRSLTQIQGVLADASQKEITNPSVKRWLNDLQHLAYDIDDVLDDLAYEAMDREFKRESEAIITSKVRKLVPSCCSNFSRSSYKMHDKLDNISIKLQDLVKEKTDLGLRVEEDQTRPRNNNNNNRRYQSSVVDPTSIVGRKDEKEALVQKLLSQAEEPCDQNFSIVPIVGMGGVGKTTLARLLYDEKQVNDHFELKAWVCVSDEFDGFGISKVIFQHVAPEVKKEFTNFNLLQVALTDHLRGKRFLLVLDDIWSESYADWETLARPFYTCAPGSKIIITTRKNQLLQKLGCNVKDPLQSLSHGDALSLFALHALGVDKFDSYLSLKQHGEGIVKKCDGLPIALISLGRSLRTKKDEYSWRNVLHSELWSSKDDVIIPALKLSYYDLSAPLKQLFAYCSLFPKDFLFDKDELVLLWMAEGFLRRSTPTPGHSTEEHLGHEYFDELLSRSFFQHAPNSESLFVMHDLLNDLAIYAAGEFFVRLENETEKNIRDEMLEKYRHVSFVREKYVSYKKFETLRRTKCLRTFLATSIGVVDTWQRFYLSSKVLVDLLPELPLLRVLHLSNFEISEVPESIGNLRHLRYLNLSKTRITHLPESMCNLYNLETLILFGCKSLTMLPNGFLKLKKLRHLDIRDTQLLKQTPLGIGKLTSLQTLSKVIIEGESGFDLAKFKNLENLCGRVSILGLEKVENTTHAREAKLSQKRFSELELVWGDELHGSRNEMLEKEVLNELKPCNEHLKELKIVSYRGLEFPEWIGDPLFHHLKHVSISGCKRCTTLPSLGQLSSLRELFIEGLDKLEVVGLELLGTGCAFPSLEILSFNDMRGWKTWLANTPKVFPRLEQLHIRKCPILVEVTLEGLPLLKDLYISGCPSLVEVSLGTLTSLNVLNIRRCDSGVLRKLVEVDSTVTKLRIEHISGLNDVVWRDVIKHLKAVEELSIKCCNEIRYVWESEVAASKVLMKLRKLEVSGCDNLVSLGEREDEDNCRSNLLTTLRSLDVSWCKNMKHCNCPDSIETLSVWFCNSITAISLPTGGQKLKSLRIIYCEKLLEREWGVQKNNRSSNMQKLESVYISFWPNLKSIVNLNFLVNLTKLSITNCENLESFPDKELPDLTSLKELEIRNCRGMDACFPRGYWPPNLCSLKIGRLKKPISEWGQQNFPISLVELTLYGGGEDGEMSSCSQLSHLLPSSLTSLDIDGFEKLESFSIGLQHLQCLSFYMCPNLKKLFHPQRLTSLQHLYFDECPSMTDLPQVIFPSLLSLIIEMNCQELKERCSERGGTYWHLISHIPLIFIFPGL